MTYKDVIDRFKSVADAHYMLKDFGYGQLSDIKVHSQEGEADYPYLFLNPSTHTRNGVNMVYNFNMIVMDVATDEDDALSNYTAIQSKCQQYIDDIIAELYYGYSDKPEIQYTNVTYTPFKERFQDSVAGMTATISILVPTPINQCIAPFNYIAPTPPLGGLILDMNKSASQGFSPDTENSPVMFETTIVDTYNGWRPPLASNYYSIIVDGTYSFVMTGTAERSTANGSFPTAPNLVSSPAGISLEPDVSNWPTNPAVGEPFDFTIQYTAVALTTATNFIAFQFPDEPPLEDTLAIIAGANLKGYLVDPPVICDPEYPNFATSISQFDNTVDTANIAWRFGNNTVTDPAIGTWSNNVFNNAVFGTFEFIIEADITFTNPGVGETFPPAPTLLVNNVIDVDANCVEDNWPTSYVAGTFRWKARYSVNLQALSPVQIISTTNTFADYTVGVGATLNIGYQA